MNRLVLLVDSDVDALGVLAEQLRSRGVTVALANDLATAVSRARSMRPHLILVAKTIAETPEYPGDLAAVPELANIPRQVVEPGQAPNAERRISQPDLEALVSRALESAREPSSPESLGELRGDLTQLSLPDLLQLLALNRRTGTLSVTTPLGQGELRVADGEVHDAVYRRLEGEKAFYRLVDERAGSFVFVPGSPPAIARITKDTSTLLMEAMRQSDEVAELRADLGGRDAAYVASDDDLDDDDPRILHDIRAALAVPRTLDELVDEVPSLDLDILRGLAVMLDTNRVRNVDQASQQAMLCPALQLPVLRALVARLSRDGFSGPARLVIASTPSRVHTFGHALLRVAGSVAPAEPPPAAPVPHPLGIVRFGEGVELEIVGLPVVDAFSPLWSIALPGAGIVVSFDRQPPTLLAVIASALEVPLATTHQLVPTFDETDQAHVAELLRAAIERAGQG